MQGALPTPQKSHPGEAYPFSRCYILCHFALAGTWDPVPPFPLHPAKQEKNSLHYLKKGGKTAAGMSQAGQTLLCWMPQMPEALRPQHQGEWVQYCLVPLLSFRLIPIGADGEEIEAELFGKFLRA